MKGIRTNISTNKSHQNKQNKRKRATQQIIQALYARGNHEKQREKNKIER
jgi:hypothetical protein